jgi:hypothetical protein
MRRPPQTDDELWFAMQALFGMEIPRKRVCPNHRAPFEAFADAFFARYPVTVWKASRGFGGKSQTLAALAMAESTLLRAGVTVLGGSSFQSLRVVEVMGEMWDAPLAPVGMLAKEPTKFDTKLINGGYVRALMASQKSVRGPHPQRLRLDEIDEMEYDILESSLGQPMSTSTLTSQIVMSSTHQYPDKTMSVILNRAHEKGWPVYEWCYRETMEPHGWLPIDAVQRKKSEVSRHMWETEYDLQEPSFEGRAIDSDSVNHLFGFGDPKRKRVDGEEGQEFTFEKPDPHGYYVTGVDWAKERDWTIIDTFRTDCTPWKRVAWSRMGRRPWPMMVEAVNRRCQKFDSPLVHDATGVGNVVHDYLDVPKVTPIVMTGRRRTDLFSNYITAIESDEMTSPMIDFAFAEHKYVSIDALFGKAHPPDSVVAGAMCWAGRQRQIMITMPESLGKANYWSNM